MRNFFLLLFCTLWPLCVEAQNLQFKVGGGLATHYGHAENVGAFKVGLGCEFEFDQHWTLTPGIAVYGKGWKDPNQRVYVFDDNGNQLFDEENGEPLQGLRRRRAAANILCLLSVSLWPDPRRGGRIRTGPLQQGRAAQSFRPRHLGLPVVIPTHGVRQVNNPSTPPRNTPK